MWPFRFVVCLACFNLAVDSFGDAFQAAPFDFIVTPVWVAFSIVSAAVWTGITVLVWREGV